MHETKSRAPTRRAIAGISFAVVALVPSTAAANERSGIPLAACTAAGTDRVAVGPVFPDSLFGRSGKLRFRLFSSSRVFALPVLERLFGNPEGEVRPGVYPA